MIDSADPRPDSSLAARLYPSPNHGERKDGRRPDSIILHYTGMADAASALLWLCNPLSEVSCHYFVFEDGRIFQLVPENRRAWHAGKSCWQGETDMNSASIGIEIVNTGHDLTAPEGEKPGPFPPVGPPFPDQQITAVIALVADIKTRWSIPNARILAHSDIAPGRKIDPGENFPWTKLAEAGLGLWPPMSRPNDGEAGMPSRDPGGKPQQSSRSWAPYHHSAAPALVRGNALPAYRLGDEGMPIAALQAMFARLGYDLAITGVYDQRSFDVVAAFQRHWRQARVDGVADGETMAVLRALMG